MPFSVPTLVHVTKRYKLFRYPVYLINFYESCVLYIGRRKACKEKWPIKLPSAYGSKDVQLWRISDMLNDLPGCSEPQIRTLCLLTLPLIWKVASSLKTILSPKIIIFQEFQHVYTEDSARLFVIFSECLHKCQLVSLEFQTLVKNIPDC